MNAVRNTLQERLEASYRGGCTRGVGTAQACEQAGERADAAQRWHPRQVAREIVEDRLSTRLRA